MNLSWRTGALQVSYTIHRVSGSFSGSEEEETLLRILPGIPPNRELLSERSSDPIYQSNLAGELDISISVNPAYGDKGKNSTRLFHCRDTEGGNDMRKTTRKTVTST